MSRFVFICAQYLVIFMTYMARRFLISKTFLHAPHNALSSHNIVLFTSTNFIVYLESIKFHPFETYLFLRILSYAKTLSQLLPMHTLPYAHSSLCTTSPSPHSSLCTTNIYRNDLFLSYSILSEIFIRITCTIYVVRGIFMIH